MVDLIKSFSLGDTSAYNNLNAWNKLADPFSFNYGNTPQAASNSLTGYDYNTNPNDFKINFADVGNFGGGGSSSPWDSFNNIFGSEGMKGFGSVAAPLASLVSSFMNYSSAKDQRKLEAERNDFMKKFALTQANNETASAQKRHGDIERRRYASSNPDERARIANEQYASDKAFTLDSYA